MKRIKIGRALLNVEVAESVFGKMRGLMSRRSLKQNGGMLFEFGYDGYHAIWMFGMRFPIDIIWLDEGRRVVDIVENARPCLLFCRTYVPRKAARYVLEVNAGFVRKHGVRAGMKAALKP